MINRFRSIRRLIGPAPESPQDLGGNGPSVGAAEPSPRLDGTADSFSGWEPLARASGLGYVQTLQTVMAVNRALLVLLLGTLVIIALLGVALLSSRDSITVYVPPDTTRGTVLTAGVPTHATVYGFAWQILQALHHWPTDGQTDYPAAIDAQAPYLTPTMRRGLHDDRTELTNRFGIDELAGRTRALHPLAAARFTPARVRRLAEGVWGVQIDARLVERAAAVTVKDLHMRYRLRVVRRDVNPRGNVWGLQLDGWLEPPQRLPDPTARNDETPRDRPVARAVTRPSGRGSG